jgi:Ala-tRNA(Pro) deacylase
MYTVEFVRSHRVWFESLLHRPASSSTRRAGSIHVPGRSVAKTVLIKAGARFVLVVLPSTRRIDLERLGEELGLAGSEVHLATLEEMGNLFSDCETGVVPPFGRLYQIETLFDSSLADVAEVVFAGNSRHEGLRMRTGDYLAIEQPSFGSFSVPIAVERPVPAEAQPDRRVG